MKICNVCGASAEDNATVCNVCGATFSTVVISENMNRGYAPNQQNMNQGYMPNQQNMNQGYMPNQMNANRGNMPNQNKPKNNVAIGIIIAIVIILLLGGAGVGIWYFTKDKDKDNTTEGTTVATTEYLTTEEDTTEEVTTEEVTTEEVGTPLEPVRKVDFSENDVKDIFGWSETYESTYYLDYFDTSVTFPDGEWKWCDADRIKQLISAGIKTIYDVDANGLTSFNDETMVYAAIGVNSDTADVIQIMLVNTGLFDGTGYSNEEIVAACIGSGAAAESVEKIEYNGKTWYRCPFGDDTNGVIFYGTFKPGALALVVYTEESDLFYETID